MFVFWVISLPPFNELTIFLHHCRCVQSAMDSLKLCCFGTKYVWEAESNDFSLPPKKNPSIIFQNMYSKWKTNNFQYIHLDGGNSNIFDVHPKTWGRFSPILTFAYVFQFGLGEKPTKTRTSLLFPYQPWVFCWLTFWGVEADPLGLKELLSRGGFQSGSRFGDFSKRGPGMMGEILPDP